LIGYAYALDQTDGNILNNFDAKDVVINLGEEALIADSGVAPRDGLALEPRVRLLLPIGHLSA
jgi:hypothetical protein